MYPTARLIAWGAFLLVALPGNAQGDESEFDVDLAREGLAVLKNYCKSCHGDDQRYPGLDVLNRATLLQPNDSAEKPFVIPGNPDQSRIWDSIDTDYMPPEDQPQPTAAERATLKRWIEEGAHFPPEPRLVREFVGEQTLMDLIDNDLRDLSDEDLPFVRYFSLAHLWNDTAGDDPTTEEDLRLIRAALSKLVNSLSSKSRIVVPRIVDPKYGTVLAIDMRDYGWSEWHWNEVLKRYPYGLKVSSKAANRVYRVAETKIPYVRADWFIANAARPPLYHSLLNLPKNAKALEASLGVNIAENFASGQLARAAFQKSGVSQQNRMVERHDTRRGGRYYWKSYDVEPGKGEEGDFTRRPTGPRFANVPGRQLAAFEHDGGEIIWTLPNGLQAYMLVDGNDVRIDSGPPEVVFDPNSHGGSFLITNGISCMGCHRNGMFPLPPDNIRPLYEKKRGQKVADKVLELYKPDDEMQALLKGDRDHFMKALAEAIVPFLQVDEDADKPVEDFAEPTTKVSNRYLLDVSIEAAARELGLADAGELKGLIRLRVFRDLGLGNWSNEGGTVSRETWERAYGSCARELQIGIPLRIR